MPDAAEAPLLLDTHYWIWHQLGDREHAPDWVVESIERAASSGRLLLSAISVWELGMLESKGRIRLQSSCEQWVTEALAMPGLTLAPLTPEIAVDSSRLPAPFHGDPADRIIVATARRMRAKLVTCDEKLLEYGRLRHITVL
jgi:PIN domain nuclease of toxin-antitoxin system